jgi:hypothetical protein
MIAGLMQALFESIVEIIFLTLGVRRALALIFLALGLITLNSGKFESCGIFLGLSVSLFGWDAVARIRTIRKSDS